MLQPVRKFLEDEERASKVLVYGMCAVGAAAFLAALVAMAFMR